MKTNNGSIPPGTTTDAIRSALAKLGTLHRSMEFLVPLTQTERQRHRAMRIGVKTLRTIGNRLAAAEDYREHLPPAFDARKFTDNATNAIELGELLRRIDQLRLEVHDTFMAVANRASVDAASVYGYIQVSATNAKRLERTVDKLATRGGGASKEHEPASPLVLPEPEATRTTSEPTTPARMPETSKAA